jgi:hypothetical protein
MSDEPVVTLLATINLDLSGRAIHVLEQAYADGHARLLIENLHNGRRFQLNIPSKYVSILETAVRDFLQRNRERHLARPKYQRQRGRTTP